MARLASCPQCNQELLVPGETGGDAWAKCPECRAFFQLKDTVSRELPAALVVETDSREADAQNAPTVADISSSITWSDAGDAEPEPSAAPELDTESLVAESQSPDDLQAAAQRIDAWFRSAKTLPDVPPMSDSDTEPGAPNEDAESSDATSAGETAEIDADLHVYTGTSPDLDLEDSLELPQSTATWDDSKHMERLLADIEGPAADEFVATSEPSTDHDDDRRDVQPTFASSAPNASNFVPPIGAKRRKKRSLVRTLLTAVVAGIVGSGLGYYALLWLRGTDGDFLHLAQYLPKAMLPGEFQTAPTQVAVNVPSNPPAQIEPTEPATDTPEESTEPPMEEPADEPAEEQASFTTPAEPETPPTDDDRYASDASDVPAPSAEPAPLDEPAAAPLTEEAATVDVATVKDAPTFTADELAAALDAAKTAQPALVAGSLEDGREVQRAKGYSYSMLADLAQKETFVDASSSPESTATLQQAGDELFRQTLADAHTRGEVAMILPKWIASKHRKHGGVLFAANLTSHENAGTVVECAAELDGGPSIRVLVPTALAGELGDSSRPLAIVGWLIDQPAEHVTGYTGSAPQAVWAGRLIPLE